MEGTNIDAMRQISLADFLARLGHEPVRRSGNEFWYRAPYRNERTPSFRVNVAKRLWYDFGLGKGGDIFTLAGEFARSGDFMAQARFIAETVRMPFVAAEKPLFLPEPSEPAFEGVEAVPLLRSPLTDYLAERGIPYAVASRHCCRLILTDVCSVFEGFMDFLSAAALGIGGNGDSLVLNSVANVGKAVKHLDGYGRIDCFLDRDDAGRRTLEALKGHYGGRVCDRSAFYDGCKDLNEYLQLTAKKEMNNNLKIKGQ